MASRAWQIAGTIARHRLDTLADAHILALPTWQRWLWKLNPLRLISRGDRSDGERLRTALTELGPVYIKLGQLLSTRPDIVPPAVAEELAALQDNVPPIPVEQVIRTIEEDLGAPLGEHFCEFDETPLAAASIAQVHTASLHSGEAVVVKVVRPGLAKQIAGDLAFFRKAATRIVRRYPNARRLKLQEVLDDYERTIYAELDMLAEAANTARLRANFADSEMLYVPRVHQALCRPRVLVLERIHGVPVSQVEELSALDVDLALLADRGVKTFFTQVFEQNFFHADMHPGNVYVDVADPANPRYIALDCAIMGTLTEADQEYLARNLLAFFQRDYAEVARLHVVSGWVPPDTNQGEFERVIREVCEPIFAKPLAEISFGQFLTTLFQTAERFEMEVQPQLVLLQKTLLYIEGLGRRLYPQLDLWTTAQPFMERWLAERVGPAAQLRRLIERAPELLEAVPEIPGQIGRLRAEQARQHREIAELRQAIVHQSSRARSAKWMGVALVLLGGALLWPGATGDWLAPIGVLSAVGGSAILLRLA